jgi:uncharacterized protein YhfF
MSTFVADGVGDSVGRAAPDPATGARLIETQSCGPRRRQALTRARHARPDAGTAEPARARTPQTCDRRALAEYVQEGEKLEHVGERLAVLDDHGEPVVTVEITGVDVLPLAEVSWKLVAAEGEGDGDVEEWRAGHRQEWETEGTTIEDHTQVVCLLFVLV